MIKVRDAFPVAALAALIALSFVGGSIATPVMRAQSNVAKTGYAPIPGGEYKIDPAHSIIGFSIRHYEINWVEGRFKDFTGTIRYDEADITRSSV